MVMSQSRIREVEGVVNPLSDMIENMGDGSGGMHMNMMGYGGSPSWVDILVRLLSFSYYSESEQRIAEPWFLAQPGPARIQPKLYEGGEVYCYLCEFVVIGGDQGPVLIRGWM